MACGGMTAFPQQEFGVDLRDRGGRDFFLQCQDIGGVAVEAARPRDLAAGAQIEQLYGDAGPVTSAQHRAFEQEIEVQLLPARSAEQLIREFGNRHRSDDEDPAKRDSAAVISSASPSAQRVVARRIDRADWHDAETRAVAARTAGGGRQLHLLSAVLAWARMVASSACVSGPAAPRPHRPGRRRSVRRRRWRRRAHHAGRAWP